MHCTKSIVQYTESIIASFQGNKDQRQLLINWNSCCARIKQRKKTFIPTFLWTTLEQKNSNSFCNSSENADY